MISIPHKQSSLLMQQLQGNAQNSTDGNQQKNLNQFRYGDINRKRKFDALKGKILKQEIQKKNHQFIHYIQNIQNKINQTSFLTQKRNKPKITKAKRNQRNMQRLNLPFQVYHYSQSEQSDNSDRQKDRQKNQPFTVEKSSQSEEKQSQSGGSAQDNKQVKRLLFKQQKGEKIYSFAKKSNNQGNGVVNSNTILPLNIFQHQPSSQPLHKHLPQQALSQLITSFLLHYTSTSQSLPSILPQTCSQLQQLLSPYYLNLQNDLTSQIQNQFFSRIYFEQQDQKLDQLIYFKQQQLQIKKNRLEMLEGIVKEIKEDREIERIIGKKIGGNLDSEGKQDRQLGNHDRRQLNKDNKSKSKNLIPYLNLQQVNYHQRIPSQQQKALTSKRKPNDQTARSYNKKSEHKVEKSSSSKAGRTYYYQKEKPKLHQNNVFKQKKQKQNERSSGQQQPYTKWPLPHSNQNPSLNHIPQPILFYPPSNLPPTSKQNIHPNIASNFISFNNLPPSYDLKPMNIPSPFISPPPPPQSFYKLQLHTLQLSSQYKQNIQSVMLYEIQHMKQWSDYLEVDIDQLQKEYEDKFMTLDVRARLAEMKDKQKSLKQKIKKKIKIFWKQVKSEKYYQSTADRKIDK